MDFSKLVTEFKNIPTGSDATNLAKFFAVLMIAVDGEITPHEIEVAKNYGTKLFKSFDANIFDETLKMAELKEFSGFSEFKQKKNQLQTIIANLNNNEKHLILIYLAILISSDNKFHIFEEHLLNEIINLLNLENNTLVNEIFESLATIKSFDSDPTQLKTMAERAWLERDNESKKAVLATLSLTEMNERAEENLKDIQRMASNSELYEDILKNLILKAQHLSGSKKISDNYLSSLFAVLPKLPFKKVMALNLAVNKDETILIDLLSDKIIDNNDKLNKA